MGADAAVPLVVGPTGEKQPLGEFLRECTKKSGLSVSKIVDDAGISRANYYLLEKNRQRPSLGTLVALLGAMGFETYLPDAEDAKAADLVVHMDDELYVVDLRWSPEERERSRERYVAATASGFGAALGGAAASRIGSTGIAVLGAAGLVARLAPGLAPKLLGEVMFVTARRLAERRAADKEAARATPAKEDVLADLRETAASMSTEELEALLTTMKAMREARAENPQP